MFGSLEAESIKYFLQTGTINGSFHFNLTRMILDCINNSIFFMPTEQNIKLCDYCGYDCPNHEERCIESDFNKWAKTKNFNPELNKAFMSVWETAQKKEYERAKPLVFTLEQILKIQERPVNLKLSPIEMLVKINSLIEHTLNNYHANATRTNVG